MQSINNGNLLEIIDLAHSLRQEHLFIANEQAAFNRLNETLSHNSSSVAQVRMEFAIICYKFSSIRIIIKLKKKKKKKKNVNFEEILFYNQKFICILLLLLSF